MRALEHRIPPPALAAAFAVAIWGVSRLAPGLEAGRAPRLWLSVPVALAGASFCIAGFRSFGKAKTTINPLKPDAASTLVSSGVYRVTRNPMYLGLSLLLLGWTLYLASPWALAIVGGFVLYIDRFQVRPEERALTALFGADYEAYRARVRRWL